MARVLIVEDDADIAEVTQRILSRKGGHEVRVSQDVEEILAACSRGEVDLVLMDISLRGVAYEGQPVDGIWISRKLKSMPQTSHIPVLLVTAHAMRGDRARFLRESSADGYVTKPILDTDLFVQTVANHLPPSRRPA